MTKPHDSPDYHIVSNRLGPGLGWAEQGWAGAGPVAQSCMWNLQRGGGGPGAGPELGAPPRAGGGSGDQKLSGPTPTPRWWWNGSGCGTTSVPRGLPARGLPPEHPRGLRGAGGTAGGACPRSGCQLAAAALVRGSGSASRVVSLSASPCTSRLVKPGSGLLCVARCLRR